MDWRMTTCPFTVYGKTDDDRPVHIRERGGPTRIRVGYPGMTIDELLDMKDLDCYFYKEIDIRPNSLNELIDHINTFVEGLTVQESCMLSKEEDDRWSDFLIGIMDKAMNNDQKNNH